jgi:hypothetical protein
MRIKVPGLNIPGRMAVLTALFAIGVVVALLSPGPVLAQTWTTLSPPAGGQQAAVSSNGAVLVFGSDGDFEASTNAGQNWFLSEHETPFFTSLACSGDGRIILASEAEGGGVCLWTNWPDWAPIRANLPGGVWTGTAASSTGRLAACGNVGIFTSIDSGNTWSTNNPTPGWTSISMSGDGQTLLGIHNSSIYVTTNFGDIWTLTTAPTNEWTQTACSFNGQRIYATATGAIYASGDFGATWVLTAAPPLLWFSVACSYDGSKVVAGFGENAVAGAGVYTSSDFGASWTSNNIPQNPGNSVACSADGSILLTGNRVWKPFQGTWAPALRVEASPGALQFAWPAPSVGYVLRESTDLAGTNWLTVTNPVVTTNCENRVVIPVPASGMSFYELQNP